MKFTVPLLALLVAACGNDLSPAEKAAQDARDVAMVEAAQKVQPPVREIGPQPIQQADVDRYNLGGPGCAFTPKDKPGPILLTGEESGIVKIGDRLVMLAADSGSDEFPRNTHEKYAGRGAWIQLTRGEGPETGAPGSITIRDRYERVIYFSAGSLSCGDMLTGA